MTISSLNADGCPPKYLGGEYYQAIAGQEESDQPSE